MFEKIKNFFGGKKGAIKTAILTTSTAATMVVTAIPAGAEATVPTVDWSTIITNSNVGGVLNGVVTSLPTLLPIAVGFIAIRKGISFVLGMLRRA